MLGILNLFVVSLFGPDCQCLVYGLPSCLSQRIFRIARRRDGHLTPISTKIKNTYLDALQRVLFTLCNKITDLA